MILRAPTVDRNGIYTPPMCSHCMSSPPSFEQEAVTGTMPFCVSQRSSTSGGQVESPQKAPESDGGVPGRCSCCSAAPAPLAEHRPRKWQAPHEKNAPGMHDQAACFLEANIQDPKLARVAPPDVGPARDAQACTDGSFPNGCQHQAQYERIVWVQAAVWSEPAT